MCLLYMHSCRQLWLLKAGAGSLVSLHSFVLEAPLVQWWDTGGCRTGTLCAHIHMGSRGHTVSEAALLVTMQFCAGVGVSVGTKP